jgi:hypothetical protein
LGEEVQMTEKSPENLRSQPKSGSLPDEINVDILEILPLDYERSRGSVPKDIKRVMIKPPIVIE